MSFWQKIALFTLPFAIGFLAVTGFLIYMGESMPLALVIQMQDSSTPVLFRPNFGNVDQRYKQIAVDHFQPEVVVLGSSRVLQFRAQFMSHNPDAFYNAAAPAWQLPEILNHLHEINHKPKIILLGIDDAWFNADYPGDPIVEPPISDFSRLFIVNRTFMQHLIDGERYDIETLLSREEPGGSGGIALGIKAIENGHGFRNDGSEQYGDFLVAQFLWQPNMRGLHQGWFEEGIEMYTPGDTLNDEALDQLRQILDYAREHDILLVGFSPPYMPSLWEQMATSERHTYIQQLIPALTDLFAEYGFQYFSYHDGAQLGATDEDFFDGWHHSERISTQLFINIAQEVPELAAYSDLEALQGIVNTAPDTFRVFPFMDD